MSEQFDAFKQAADKALTEFAGGSDAIVKLVDELLKAQADDLETSFMQGTAPPGGQGF